MEYPSPTARNPVPVSSQEMLISLCLGQGNQVTSRMEAENFLSSSPIGKSSLQSSDQDNQPFRQGNASISNEIQFFWNRRSERLTGLRAEPSHLLTSSSVTSPICYGNDVGTPAWERIFGKVVKLSTRRFPHRPAKWSSSRRRETSYVS